MNQADQDFDDNWAVRHLSELEGTLSSPQPFSSSAAQNVHNMDPGELRRRAYLACRQCRFRKIKCDATRPICLTCIRRRCPKCEYDDEPRRRGPDRHPRVRTHHASGPPPSSIRPRHSQKRSSKDIVVAPIIPSTTQSPPYTTLDASPTTSRMVLPNDSLIPPRGSFGSIRLHPSPGTSRLFHQGSVDETPSHDLFGASPSMRPSQPCLHHSGTRPLGPNDSLLPPSVHRLHSIVDSRPHDPYLPDNDPHSSSESRYSHLMNPIQGATGADAGKRQVVRSPYISAPSSFQMPMGTNLVYSDPLVETTDHMSPSAHDMNFLPMASSRMQGTLVYNRFQDFGNDHQNHENAGESRLEGYWTPTPDTLAAHSYEMLDQPSVEFPRQMWWESLVRYYGGPRPLATRRITDDLSHFFRVSSAPIPFINVPVFFSTFYHPSQREQVQPSLVVAILAVSTLLQSSDIIGSGETGRLKALELRDLAQSHFDMSLNSGWITPGLAQAALLLVMFEASCHPVHSESRARSALFLLDSLILGLGLLDLDKEEYNVTTFSPNSVPSLFVPFSDPIDQAVISQGATKRGCSCPRLQLSTTSPSSLKLTPLWVTGPGWSTEWDDVETRREEQRRVVWTALTLTSSLLSYYDSAMSQNLSIAKPWNFNIFLPGEKLFGTPQMQDDLAAKRSIWALRSRCSMLYTSCISVHHDESISEYDKGQFAVQAWLESERIEKLLDMHTCNIEKANLSYGRQILFDTKSLVSSQYSRYIPHPNIGNPHFHRDMALLWLSHQNNVVQQILGTLPRVTTLDRLLASRPYFILWLHDQFARYLAIWRQDPTLLIALHLCIQLLQIVERLMILFPSNYPRQKYEVLHQHLVDACIFAGIPPPSPPSYINL